MKYSLIYEQINKYECMVRLLQKAPLRGVPFKESVIEIIFISIPHIYLVLKYYTFSFCYMYIHHTMKKK